MKQIQKIGLLCAVLLWGSVCQSQTTNNEPFSVCFIGYDLPLANQIPSGLSKAPLRGLYVDLADSLAKRFGSSLASHFVLQAFFSRPVRAGLMDFKCAMQMGLPRTGSDWYIPKKIALTKAYMKLGFAIVVPADKDISNFEDLKGKTVAVQSGSPAHFAMSKLENTPLVYAIDAEPALDLFIAGKADAAFIWGPTAGYINKFKYDGKYKVIPTDIEWPVAIGVRADDLALRDKLNEHLADLKDYIDLLSERYGFPKGEPIKIPELAKNPYADLK